MPETLLRTPLHDLHTELGARMVPFAGYEMPVQYPSGIIAEHSWTRASAGLFDVSHMGQCFVTGADFAAAAAAMETLVPADIAGLLPRQQRYSQLLDADGGIIDDLMIARSAYAGAEGRLYLVVNASRKAVDYAHIAAKLPPGIAFSANEELALIALQGPKAEEALAKPAPGVRDLGFMRCGSFSLDGARAHITRSGYTGEDGFEISVFAKDVMRICRMLLADPLVKPVGLGARDSLRLEAGLCLHGHDIDETTSPVEAGLVWSIGKRRRAGGGYPGCERVGRELKDGPKRKRVGLLPDARGPAREGTVILEPGGRRIGIVTSGGFGPSVNRPIAMGYVETAFAAPGTAVTLIVRDKPVAARIAALPFVPHRYRK